MAAYVVARTGLYLSPLLQCSMVRVLSSMDVHTVREVVRVYLNSDCWITIKCNFYHFTVKPPLGVVSSP
jgi:hypothetical protein